MYSRCLFCRAALGRNESLEHFPLGRRLAYDQANGRLWVICRRCERWNLTPVEERWEAMEEAERAYRRSRLRIATENIGLAALADGLELVRIGAPPRLELAGWRYGDQFGRRRRKYLAVTGLGMAVPAVTMLGSFGLAAAVAGAGVVFGHIGLDLMRTRRDRKVPTVFLVVEGGRILPLTLHDTWTATLVAQPTSREWHLSVRHRRSEASDGGQPVYGRWQAYEQHPAAAVLRGDVALRALAVLMPHANPTGATRRGVREAVRVIEASTDIEQFVYGAAATRRSPAACPEPNPLTQLPAAVRLALEMVLHEEDERRALEGELAALEARWREAEEIANIADSLLLPPNIEAHLQALRQARQL